MRKITLMIIFFLSAVISTAMPQFSLVRAQNVFTDADNTLVGTVTEDQFMLYAPLILLAGTLLIIAYFYIKNKNAPHIKTTTKEIS